MIVLGKQKKPRCFQNRTVVPLKYYNKNKKLGVLTKEIWSDILVSLNAEMASQNREIILFVDNAAPHNITNIFTKVLVKCLLSNTTSISLPLDQGIINAFKSYDLAKSINLLKATLIIKRPW